MSQYNLKPKIKINNINISIGIKAILKNLKIFNVIETYPGVRTKKIIDDLRNNGYNGAIIKSEEFSTVSKNKFRDFIFDDLTDDRVFGKFTNKEYKEIFDINKINTFIKNNKNNKIVVIGIGAHLFSHLESILFYVDVTRWEIQLRYRNNEGVYFKQGLEDEKSRNFKRGYFIEWRMADRIKKLIWNKINFYVDDTNKELKLIGKCTLDKIIENASKRPFRLVPYFDAGIWGGKWMESKFNLGKNKHNRWAWGFDGVPEENSVIFENDNKDFIEMPAINIVFFQARNLLGENILNRFGSEFPIRFDFLDTIKGQNLSLQVHPTTKYMKDKFRGYYAQEESYYILDVDKSEGSFCYLGLKKNITKKEFIEASKRAQKTGIFDVDKYVNKFKVKKHDHINHPAGCIHSSGRGCMVLEISSTPYIFTFKLWDWARVDFDGKPRPINIEHGNNVIDEFFDTDQCIAECVSPTKLITNKNGTIEEKTGLHPRQFIETRRFTIPSGNIARISVHGSVNMLNLVSGTKAQIKSVDNSFEPLIVSFAETFIVPESCKEFIIESKDDKKIKLLQAFVKNKKVPY